MILKNKIIFSHFQYESHNLEKKIILPKEDVIKFLYYFQYKSDYYC